MNPYLQLELYLRSEISYYFERRNAKHFTLKHEDAKSFRRAYIRAKIRDLKVVRINKRSIRHSFGLLGLEEVYIDRQQLDSIKQLADDCSSMIGCSDNDYLWKDAIKHIDEMLSSNSLPPRKI